MTFSLEAVTCLAEFTLRLHWERLKRMDASVTWRLLSSRTECVVEAMIAASVTVVGGDVASARFWTDCWL